MNKLLLLLACMILIVPILTTAYNVSGHPNYQYWDDFSDCTAANPTGSCGWANLTAAYVNRKSIVTLNGKTWLNMSYTNSYTYRENLWTKARGNVVSVQYTVLWRRMSPATKARADFMFTQDITGIGGNIPKGYMYIYQSNSTPTTFFRIYTGTAEFSTTRFPTYSVNREYTVCMQLSNKSSFDSSMRPSIIINKTYVLTNNHSIDAAQFSSLDSLIFWTDANNGNGTYFTGVKVWYGNCTSEPIIPPTTASTVSLTYPANKTHENTVSWNRTFILTTDKKADCIVNNSDWTLARDNQTVFNFNRGTIPTDRQYIIKFMCNNSGSYWRNATINLTIDNTNPTMVIGQYRGKWFGQDHGSERNGNNSYWNSSFWFSWSTSDTYLYKMQTRINKIVGNVSVYTRLISANATTSYNLSKQVKNNATYTDGNYSVLLETTDSHTATEFSESFTTDIKEEIITDKGVSLKEITHELDNGDFKILMPLDISITPMREEDKISYDIVAEKEGATYQIIEGDSIEPIQNSEYPCHFVVNFKDMEGYWFDCVGLDNPKVTEIEKNKRYRIDYDIGKSLQVRESSLGGLNYVKKSFNFYIDTVKPKFYCTGSGSNYSAHCKNTTGTSSLSITFNTTEKANFTQKISLTSCNTNFISTSTFSEMNNLTKTAIFNGLISNTTYHINITIFDRADNQKSFCFNQTTKISIIKNANISLNSQNNIMIGSCPAIGRNLFREWKWLINGSEVLRNNNITGKINISNISFNIVPTNRNYAFDGNFNNYASSVNSFIMYSRYNNLTTNQIKYIFRGDTPTLGFWNFVKSSYDFFYDSVFGIPIFNDTFINTTNYLNSTRGMIMYSKITDFSSHNRLYDSNLYYTPRMTTNHMVYNLTPRSNGIFKFVCRSFDGVSYTTWSESSDLYYPPLSNLSLNFLDETTGKKITGYNISATLINEGINVTVISTITGSSSLINLYPGKYEIRYSGIPYFPRTYYIDIISKQNGSINLYLLNITIGSRVILKVYDENSDNAPNITITQQRQYGNTFITVGMAKTNFEGEAILYAELYDVWYRLVYSDLAGNVLKISDPSPFNRIDPTDQVSLQDRPFASFAAFDDMRYNLSVINVTNKLYYRLLYSSTGGLARGLCLNVKRTTTSGILTICNNCTSSASGSITCYINHTLPGEYMATALIDTNSTGSWFALDMLMYKLVRGNPTAQEGAFLMMILIGSLGFMGLSTITGSIILLILGLALAAISGFVVGIGWGSISMIIVIGGIIIFFISKRGSQ